MDWGGGKAHGSFSLNQHAIDGSTPGQQCSQLQSQTPAQAGVAQAPKRGREGQGRQEGRSRRQAS
eukprot:10134152-Heterocapsa_arctica.AAC.1